VGSARLRELLKNAREQEKIEEKIDRENGYFTSDL